MAKTSAWQRKEGQSPSGGLNAKGRASAKAEGHNLKPPQPEGGSRKNSFCARMTGMKEKLTSKETANDPDSRINKSLRKWNCHADGGPVWDKPRPKKLGKPEPLSSKEKKSAKAMAKAAGRPYPNLVDNMRAARADGGSVRPEMGAGGDAFKAAMKAAQDVIRAYHGSPHKFDKFDISKIGTGEGAQAYGHGLYFAGNENVARNYLGNPEARYKRLSGHMEPKEEFAFDLATNSSEPRDMDIMMPLVKKYGSNIDFDEAQKLATDALKNRGHMYEVGIRANPEHLLDWDKPLRDQSSYVQKALSPKNLGLTEGGPSGQWNGRIGWADETGLPLGPVTTGSARPSQIFQDYDAPASIYRSLGRENPALSSEKLNAAGIPGIKYLDQGSRMSGEGSSNYVMFDPNLIDIMRRYAKGGAVNQAMEFVRRHRQEGGELEGDVQFAPSEEDKLRQIAKEPSYADYFSAPLKYSVETMVSPDIAPQRAMKALVEAPEAAKQFAQGAAQSAYSGATLPGDVAMGRVDPMSDEGFRRAQELAGLAQTGSFGFTRPVGSLASGASRPTSEFAAAERAMEAVPTQTAYQRMLTDIGHYSPAAEAAATLKQEKGPASQMLASLRNLPGVKPEELKWSGVENAFQPNETVTRQQLVDYMHKNLPNVEETVRRKQSSYPYREADEWQEAIDTAERRRNFDEAERLQRAWEEYEGHGAAWGGDKPPKFEQYSLPGGQNYREVLMHLTPKKNAPIESGPSAATMLFENNMKNKYGSNNFSSIYNKLSPSEVDKYEMLVREDRNSQKTASMLQDKANNYKSSHWDEPNVLGHLRMSDRTGPEGEKILHLEELQSDWGQEGRKKGFKPELTGDEVKQYDALNLKRRELEKLVANGDDADFATQKAVDDLSLVNRQMEDLSNKMTSARSGLPSAPYVTNTQHWTDLGLKRALREAAEGGYDKMIWTPGEEQAARYDLSKQISKIAVPVVNEDGSRSVRIDAINGLPIKMMVDKNGVVEGYGSAASQFQGKKLDEVVGKEIADKIMSAENPMSLEGEGLKVGGEGMKSFYDKVVPTQLSKLIKKLDPKAKIEMGSHSLPVRKKDWDSKAAYKKLTEEAGGEAAWNALPKAERDKRLNAARNVQAHVLYITPELRKRILEGLPAYAKGGAVESAMNFVRRYRQEGGKLEGGVEFMDTPQFEDSGSLMVGRYGEDKPQPTAHEFVQQQLRTGEPQLPQYDPEAGIETAKEAAHLGAYMHPVTRPFAQAYDAYNAAREVMQNPKDPYAWGGLGLSTMFPGSSRATQLAGAASAGAGVLGPDEAEAGPNTKFLTDLAHFYRSHYDPSARIFGSPTTIKGNRTVAKNWLSDVKLSRPVEEMSVMSQGHRPMVAESFMEPEEMAGKAMITGLGDRTPAGYELTHINEEELANPVNFMGGMGFGRDIASQGRDRSIWGSAKTRAQAIANQAKRAADEGMEPVFTYVAQGPQSGDFSHHMQDIILGQIQQHKMDDKLAEFIDRRMRENQTASGSTFAPKPNWVGVKSPEMAERMRQRADERVKLTKLMDSATFRDAPGFADVGAARFAATDPSLMYDPSFSAGKSFMTINPRGEIVTNPMHPHPSYNTQISAGDTGHGYLGRFEYELPPELHFKHYRENEIKPSLRGKPLDKQTMSILKQTPTVVATPEWVDMASEYQDIMRRLYGRRRP